MVLYWPSSASSAAPGEIIRTICKQCYTDSVSFAYILHRHQRDPTPTDLCLDIHLDMVGYFIVLALQTDAGQYFM